METTAALLQLSLLHLTMAMVPGPNTFVVSHLAMSRSRLAALGAVMGVTVASVLWVAASLAGVGFMLHKAGALYNLLRLAGAAYLAFIGYRMLRSALAPGARSRPALPARSPFVLGLLTTLGNPKSAIFWTSAFVVLVPSNVTPWFLAAVMLIVAVQSAAWYATVALLLSTGPARRRYAMTARLLDAIGGGAMVFFGLRTANELRRELALRSLS